MRYFVNKRGNGGYVTSPEAVLLRISSLAPAL